MHNSPHTNMLLCLDYIMSAHTLVMNMLKHPHNAPIIPSTAWHACCAVNSTRPQEQPQQHCQGAQSFTSAQQTHPVAAPYHSAAIHHQTNQQCQLP
jgi:hypothetical protein